MPDLNSLPPSQNNSNRSSPVSQQRSQAPLSRPLSSNPNAAGPLTISINPSTVTSSSSPRVSRSPNMERRRSSLLRDFNASEGHAANGSSASGHSPTLTSQLPQPLFQHHSQHQRAPSLGELHQELENEQEAQVNRLLAMIRQQQAQIQQLQSQSPLPPAQTGRGDSALAGVTSNTASETSTATSNNAIASSTPGSSRPSSRVPSRSQSQIHAGLPQSQATTVVSQSQPLQQGGPPSASSSLSRESSYQRPGSRTESVSQPSHGSSPSARPNEGAPDWAIGHYGLVNRERERDDLTFYQTETAMVQRENQMLKGRIRELERQIQELGFRAVGEEEDAHAGISGQ